MRVSHVRVEIAKFKKTFTPKKNQKKTKKNQKKTKKKTKKKPKKTKRQSFKLHNEHISSSNTSDTPLIKKKTKNVPIRAFNKVISEDTAETTTSRTDEHVNEKTREKEAFSGGDFFQNLTL